MSRKLRILPVMLVMALVFVVVLPSSAQDEIESVCLITDVGRVNDGTFNQFAFDGMTAAATEYDLETDFIETEAETDYNDNIGTCVDEGFDIIVTVGFLIQDATIDAAIANPETFFIGVDQDATAREDTPENFVGIQYREDQAGFLVGALAALVANQNDADVIAGVYGIDLPAVVRFRNGYEQGAQYINPEWEIGTNILGSYSDSFTDQAQGISTANQFIGEGAAVIFGAGGPLGSAAISEAAQQGVFVVGVDQDEYLTTFDSGEAEGAEFLISSAIKRVDQGVIDMVAALAEGDMDAFPGATNYILNIDNAGVGFAPKNDADLDDALYEEVEAILDMLISGELETGVDPVSGDLLEDMEMDMEEDMEAEPETTEESSD